MYARKRQRAMARLVSASSRNRYNYEVRPINFSFRVTFPSASSVTARQNVKTPANLPLSPLCRSSPPPRIIIIIIIFWPFQVFWQISRQPYLDISLDPHREAKKKKKRELEIRQLSAMVLVQEQIRNQTIEAG
ncbi:uncharacterized protein CIMG_11720 [Coccidioides immitis RS]|uniref:Uncharacterized protein n=1 Tax=Coccidioides immitis (strain RS) TaxID=246410 RepID=A0A0D8JUA4_COCIM|nr:uncharacterized protein CIMG_11720 [Coccidioides immitis RS]KJF60541.1 hypothetical protein CIMG_11720 [Coccidioides immitis RS]